MAKKIHYPGSYYDCAGFERWLNNLAAEGLLLKGFTLFGKTPIFEESALPRIRYYVEPDFGQYSQDDTKKVYTQFGWKFLDEHRGICLIYKSEDQLASKPQKVFEEHDWNKKWRKLWVDFVGFLLLDTFTLYRLFQDGFQSFFLAEPNLNDSITYLGAFYFVAFSLLFILLLVPTIERLYGIVTWNRCIRNHEDPPRWPLIIALRKGRKVVIWALIVVLCLSWIIYSVM